MFSYSFGFDAQMTECAYPKYINDTLPRSKLGYTTNNQYPMFPPKMADGRSLISSWNSESVSDLEFRQENAENFIRLSPLSPNWAYRRYMQKNGYELMAKNFIDTANDTGSEIPLPNMSENKQRDRNAPFLFDSLGENPKPNGYQESDLKDLYMSREQLNARLYAPKIV